VSRKHKWEPNFWNKNVWGTANLLFETVDNGLILSVEYHEQSSSNRIHIRRYFKDGNAAAAWIKKFMTKPKVEVVK
jgi:hypothetical protein